MVMVLGCCYSTHPLPAIRRVVTHRHFQPSTHFFLFASFVRIFIFIFYILCLGFFYNSALFYDLFLFCVLYCRKRSVQAMYEWEKGNVCAFLFCVCFVVVVTDGVFAFKVIHLSIFGNESTQENSLKCGRQWVEKCLWFGGMVQHLWYECGQMGLLGGWAVRHQGIWTDG